MLLLGDQHCPVACGSQNDCMPVVRIQSGNFAQLKKILRFQQSLGLRFPDGSVAVVMMLTHLIRVGESQYWKELKSFSQWCHNNFKLNVLPALPPFPMYPTNIINTIRHFYARLQALHHADSRRARDESFSLWEVLASLCVELKSKPVRISTPPIYIPEINQGSSINFTDSFMEGFDAKWDSGMPTVVEKAFLKLLCKQVSSIIEYTGGQQIIMPTDNSICGALQDFSDGLKEVSGRTIYVMGSSIMVKAEKTISTIASPHNIDVVPLVKGGDYKSHFFDQDRDEYLETLRAGSPKDICVINFLGNHLLRKKSFYPEDIDAERRIWHMREPGLLTEENFNLLIADVNHILKEVRNKFKGAIFLIGPLPRFIKKCCDVPSHLIKDDLHHPVDMVTYTEEFSKCAEDFISFPTRSAMIHFTEIFGSSVAPNLVRDNVHLGDTAMLKFAQFCVRLLLRTPPPVVTGSADGKLSFSGRLSAVNISLSPTLVGFEDEEENVSGGEKSKEADNAENRSGGAKSMDL